MVSITVLPGDFVLLDTGEEGVVITSHIGTADVMIGPEIRTVPIDTVQRSEPNRGVEQ
jgi:hypothetical protein